MKRIISVVLVVLLLGAVMVPCAFAAGTGSLTYALKTDVSEGEVLKTGSIVTVSFVVESESEHSISVMQNEIIYDQTFFEYVADSATAVKSGSNALFQTRVGGTNIIKCSYLSRSGGKFAKEETMCTFQLRVIGNSGNGWLKNDWNCAIAYNENNALCNLKDGGEVSIAANGPCHPFKDVKNTDWFHSAVDYVYKNRLMNGVSDDAFGPNSTMTRAMLVTVLYRLSGSPAVSANKTFTDVKANTWYTNAVIWANANGIVQGYSETRFGPDDYVTREQIATIIYRYAKMRGIDVSSGANLGIYTDAGKVSGWAYDAMSWANGEGFITGRTSTTLVPGSSATRAEVATILMRFCQKYK